MAVNPNSLSNLKKFQPGQSGNPSGSSKRAAISSAIQTRLARIGQDGLTDAQRVADVLVDGALGGDIQFIKELFNRYEGKVAEVLLTDFLPDEQSIEGLKKLRERRANRGST